MAKSFTSSIFSAGKDLITSKISKVCVSVIVLKLYNQPLKVSRTPRSSSTIKTELDIYFIKILTIETSKVINWRSGLNITYATKTYDKVSPNIGNIFFVQPPNSGKAT